MCDYLKYDDNGMIEPICPAKEGVHSTDDDSVFEGKTTILLDAAAADKTGGTLLGVTAETNAGGYTGYGYAAGFDKAYFGIDFLAISGIERTAKLKLRYRSRDNARLFLMVNNIMIFPNGVDYEQHDKKQHILPECEEWREIYLPNITLKEGDNHIRLYNGNRPEPSNSGFMLDHIAVEEI